MKKAEFLEALQAEHDAMERAIAGLTPEQMAEPVRSDGWSVKDLLAHIAAWEAEIVTALFHSRLGRNPSLTQALANVDVWNAERRAENARRPLERVLADWRGVRHALIQRIKGWDAEHLESELSWRPGLTLADLVAANSFEHEAEHRAEIEAWRRRTTVPPAERAAG